MQTVTCAGHTLTWQEHSPGEHTFIFINGYSGCRLIWGHELELFKPLGRCITLDLPGHYPAQAPRHYPQLSQESLIDLETQAIKQILGDSPATLIGHSTGGLTVLGVAAKLPRQIDRVICIAPVVWGPLTGLLRYAQGLLRYRLYPAFYLSWGVTQMASAAYMMGFSFYVHHRLSHWRNKRAWSVCRASYPWYSRHQLWNLAVTVKLLEKCDIRPLAPQVTMPVLITAGDCDPVVPPRQFHWLAEHLPEATLYMFEQAGHMPHVEQPLQWEQAVTDWLVTHPVG